MIYSIFITPLKDGLLFSFPTWESETEIIALPRSFMKTMLRKSSIFFPEHIALHNMHMRIVV